MFESGANSSEVKNNDAFTKSVLEIKGLPHSSFLDLALHLGKDTPLNISSNMASLTADIKPRLSETDQEDRKSLKPRAEEDISFFGTCQMKVNFLSDVER